MVVLGSRGYSNACQTVRLISLVTAALAPINGGKFATYVKWLPLEHLHGLLEHFDLRLDLHLPIREFLRVRHCVVRRRLGLIHLVYHRSG